MSLYIRLLAMALLCTAAHAASEIDMEDIADESAVPFTMCRVEPFETHTVVLNNVTWGGLDFVVRMDVTMCSDRPAPPLVSFSVQNATAVSREGAAVITLPDLGSLDYTLTPRDGEMRLSSALYWRGVAAYRLTLCSDVLLGTPGVCHAQSALPILLIVFWLIPAAVCAVVLVLAALRKCYTQHRRAASPPPKVQPTPPKG